MLSVYEPMLLKSNIVWEITSTNERVVMESLLGVISSMLISAGAIRISIRRRSFGTGSQRYFSMKKRNLFSRNIPRIKDENKRIKRYF